MATKKAETEAAPVSEETEVQNPKDDDAPAETVEATEADEAANQVVADTAAAAAAADAVQVLPDDTDALNANLEAQQAENLARAHAQVDDNTFIVPTEAGRTPAAIELPVPHFEVGDYVMAGASGVSNANGTYLLDDAGCVTEFVPAEGE